MSNRFAFILRLWHEAPGQTTDNESESEMRGSLQMANSEDVVYFHSLEQVPGLLEKMTGWTDTAVNPPTTGREQLYDNRQNTEVSDDET